MKKTIKSLLAIAIAAFSFAACSDVPEPYQIPGTGGNGGGGQEIAGAEGTGQLTDPYNCVAAINAGKELAVNATTDWMFIKGKVSSIKEQYGTQYGNGTFYISDDGTTQNQFYVYRAMYLGNAKFASGDAEIKKGDEVIICAKITNYNGTIETMQKEGFLYSLNGVDRGGDPTGGGSGEVTGDPKGTGTQADPYNVAAVLNFINTLGADKESDNAVYISGKVKEVKEQFGTQYGNGTFTMVDEGSNAEFTAYRVLYLGNKKFASGNTEIKTGDEVIVYGKVVNFRGNTPETAQNTGYLYSLNGKTDGGGDTPAPTPGEPKGTGTQADPFNVAAAVAKCKDTGETATDDIFFVTGIANADYTVDATYKNITIELVDEEGASEKFTAYRVKGADGQNLKGGYKIPKGATVIVSGKLVNFKSNTPETAQNTGTLVSINGQAPELDDGTSGGGTEPGGSGEAASELTNGDFETWADGLPTGWKSASTASSATLEQSTDAHGGSYAVIVKGDAANNKRLASQEIKLAAGNYAFSFWVKPTTSNKAQVRPGYVPVTDGKVGNYAYGDYATLSEGWQQVTHEFTLTAETTICLVVMNPKASGYSSGEDVIIDDATLVKK